ncbi:MAG: GGDEF domain-containing protein, partial [Clostridia bacterium]|nr:GGDEF domain-containing protein [Clostridia bacterium]
MNSGKLDATISTNVAAKDIVKFHWNSLIKIGSSPYYFATNKRRPDILADLNEANAKIQQSDWYYNEKVYLKYYGKTSASAAGLSQADMEWLEKKKTVVIGYMDHTLPYSDSNEKGELIGLLPSFMEHMKERYGVDFLTKEFSSFEQMKIALDNGEIDTMFPTYGSYWIAEKNNIMVTDALTTSYVLMVYSGQYDENPTSVIAITDESATQQFYVEEHYSDSEVLRCESMADCIRAVIEGKATCTLMCSDVYYANRNEFESLGDFSITNTGYETTVSFATRKEDIDMYSFMKKCVSSITEGEVNEALIASRHVKSELSVKQFLQKHIMMVLIVVGIIFILSFSFFIYYVISSRRALRLARSNLELNEKAYIDFATGLPNKNKCKEVTSSPLPIEKPTACFMLDLNDLKVINDTLGHEVGDLMILNFAKLLRQTVPPQYFVGRFGGDEFIVIAEGVADKKEAEHILEKIRDIVFKFNGDSGEFKLSYACGYAFSEDFPFCSVMELLNIADQNMYEDKKRGKKLGLKTE